MEWYHSPAEGGTLRPDLRERIALPALRIGAQLALFLCGYRVLSQDDYLRLSVAAQIAKRWIWFPDAIFLPAHFWAYALPLKAGLPLGAGIGLTVCLAGATTLLLYEILRLCGAKPGVSAAAALLTSLQPLSLWLGGVPVSETLAGFFLLASLWGLFKGGAGPLFLSALCAALASLTRYELWPVAAFLALAHLARRTARPPAAFLASLALSGIGAVLLWRMAQPDPWAAPIFVFREVTGAARSPVEAHKTLLGFFAFTPLLFPSLLLLAGRARPLLSRNRNVRLLFGAALAALLSVAAFFAAGYFPVTFPARLLYFPTLLAIPLAALALEPFLGRLSRGARLALLLLPSLLFLGLASRPPVEVREETLRAAGRLALLLRSGAAGRSVFVERVDLGARVLWGLNGGDPRLAFGPIASFDARLHSCALTASRASARSVAAATGWPAIWSEGKYSLFCRSLTGPGKDGADPRDPRASPAPPHGRGS